MLHYQILEIQGYLCIKCDMKSHCIGYICICLLQGGPRPIETPFGPVSEDVMSAICIMLFCCFPLGVLALIAEYQVCIDTSVMGV